ncbi:MAG: hypothetical protein ACR2QU_07290, partial [Gammaproteobacteria bacterium]
MPLANHRIHNILRSALMTLLLAANALSAGIAEAQPELPGCWQEMEIEAKWKIGNKKFNEMRKTFSVQAGLFDRYRLDVRWDGRTNQFIDNFYDDGSRSLSKALHTFRH